jgi:glycosyltransferase involved in cell wall biosynthesis
MDAIPAVMAPDAIAPLVSVIIPHLNQVELLARCLDSVLAQHLAAGPVEIIVVDNGSTVPMEATKARYPHVRWAEERQAGPGPARNAGIALAKGSILAFIDADCRADPDWLQTAVAAIMAAPDRGAVAGNVLVDCVDFGRMTGVEAYETVFAYRFKMYVEKKGFAGTGNLAMARSVQQRVGDFAGIGVAEDVNWGQRATALGLRFTYLPAMRIWHPARPDFAALRLKWCRHIAHEHAEHRANARPTWLWLARSLALVASILPDGIRMLVDDRLHNFGNRVRGIGTLARIRLYRSQEMLRLLRGGDVSGAAAWNRG